MSLLLRISMVGVVLLNLGFVAITESAQPAWLVPLFVLALVSPWLIRLTRFRAYGWAWNASILVTFAMLVQHVTSGGAQFLLEDGLQLAGLCQVHLVNNLTDKQRPDILYFNSFLVAVVTSFLSFDLAYFGLFLVYAPLLLLSMQLLTLSRVSTTVDGAILRRCLGQGVIRSSGVLCCTAAAFLFLPRNFERRGPLGELHLDSAAAFMKVDFDKDIDLSKSGRMVGSDRVVMKIRRERGSRSEVPVYWRGATLDVFDGQQWRATGDPVVTHPWKNLARGEWERGSAAGGLLLRVELLPPAPTRLFAPLQARRVVLDNVQNWRPVEACPDLTFRHDRTLRDRRLLYYTVECSETDDEAPEHRADASQHLWVDENLIPPALMTLEKAVHASSPRPEAAIRRVERARRHLEDHFEYLRPGEPEAARSLEEFLEGNAGAHCEYFATVLALLLRRQAIPCRLVTGYCSQEWDDDGRVLTVRSNHAHAWVEVLDPNLGWYTVDATPAADESQWLGNSLIDRLRRLASLFWEDVTGFDAQARARVLQWIRERLGESSDWCARNLGVLALLTSACIAGFCRWLSNRRRMPAAVKDYLLALRRARLQRKPGETPREMVTRARGIGLETARMQMLEEATMTHETARYS